MTTNGENNLGKIIRQRRVLIPLTFQELAARSGVSASHLGRIERGERFPSAHILQKMAEPLGLDEAELLGLAGYLSPSTTEDKTQYNLLKLDPRVVRALISEPVEVQLTVIGILDILKSLATKPHISFAEYARRNYPQLDEDIITMIEDILKHPEG